MIEAVLSVRQISKHFPVSRGFLGTHKGHVHAVDEVSFELDRRETLGLVGESGCGKSTIGRLITRLTAPTAGTVLFDGCNVTAAAGQDLKRIRRRLQIMFQDPYSSLNPRMTVGRAVGEPLVIHALCDKSEIRDRVAQMLGKVGLPPEYMRRYPHELSGGQRQRVGIARALITGPQLVVADEPVSALDVSIQAQVLNLLDELKEEFQLSMIMISHNMAVIQHACDRVAVMYLGRIVEIAPADEIVMAPRHPYTEALVSAVPDPDPGTRQVRRRIILRSDVPSPVHPPPGCRFHTRCTHAEARCMTEVPELRKIRPQHLVACHFSEKIYGIA